VSGSIVYGNQADTSEDESMATEMEILKAKLASLEAQLAAKNAFTLEVGDSGWVVIKFASGGRYPTSLPYDRLSALLDGAEQVREFITSNQTKMGQLMDARRAANKAAVGNGKVN
jgi:hypothetical protein